MDYLGKIVKIKSGAWKNEIGYVISILDSDRVRVRFFDRIQAVFFTSEFKIVGCVQEIVNDINEYDTKTVNFTQIKRYE